MPEHDSPPNNLQSRFREVVLADQLFSPRSTVLVGVSGRADSVALIHLLHGLGNEFALNLVVAHIPDDHASGAPALEPFVRELAQRLHASYVSAAATEDAGATPPDARVLHRLAALERVMARTRASRVATGETSDDVAEQFLASLVREDDAPTAVSLSTNGTFVHPLLSFTRAEILTFLADRQIPFQTDQLALALSSREQKIRMLILPMIRRHIASSAVTNLAAAAQCTLDDRRFVEEVARAARTEVGWTERASGVTLDQSRWSALPASLRRRVIMDAVKTLVPTLLSSRAALFSLDARCRRLADGGVTEAHGLKITYSNGTLTIGKF